MDVKPKLEKAVKIKAIFLYPVRGIRGIKVDHCEITPFGLKNDRNWVIISRKTMKPLACHNSHLITYLRQGFVKDSTRLKLYLQDKLCFPDITKREQYLDFAKKYDEEQDLIECADNYRGLKEDEEVNKWLSTILEEEVFIMRA